MKFKYLLAILLLLCLCGTAYASDINTTDVQSTQDTDLALNTEEPIASNDLSSVEETNNQNTVSSNNNMLSSNEDESIITDESPLNLTVPNMEYTWGSGGIVNVEVETEASNITAEIYASNGDNKTNQLIITGNDKVGNKIITTKSSYSLNAGNYTLIVTTNDINYPTQISKTANITVNKKDVSDKIVIYVTTVTDDYTIDSVTYDADWCTPNFRVGMSTWEWNKDMQYSEEGFPLPTTFYHTFSNSIILFNKSRDNVNKNGDYYKLKNLTGSTSYELYIELNDANCKGNTTKNIYINKGTLRELSIPEITLGYGESVNVTENAILSIVEQSEDDKFINVNGTVITVSSGLTKGEHTFTFEVSDEDPNWNSPSNLLFTVNIGNSSSTIDDIPPFAFDYGETKTINVTYTGAINVTASIVGNESIELKVGNKTITIPVLNAGNYTLNITTITDENHTSVSKTVNFTVNKVNSSIDDIDSFAFDYGDSKTINVTYTNATNINASIVGNESFELIVEDNNITIPSGLDTGNYTLNITTITDENHNSVSKLVDFTVNKLNSSIDDISPFAFDYGETKTINVTYTNATNINASIVGNASIPLKVEGNNITIPVLNAGNYTLNITTITDNNHNSVSKTVNFTVNKIDSGLNIESVTPVPVHVDENMAVTISLNNKTGKVRVSIGNFAKEYTAEEGIVNAVLPIISVAGEYTLTVKTDAVGNYKAGIVSENVTVQNWNFTELQKLIDDAINNNETEVDLGNHTYVCEPGEKPIKVNESIIINGNGTTIDVNNGTGAFDIESDDVEINNMTIKNANGTAISGVGDDIVINDVTLTDNNGTAIDITGDDTVIDNVDIKNNNGTGIIIDGDGAIVEDVNLNNVTQAGVVITGDNTTVDNVNITNAGMGINVAGNNTEITDITGKNIDGQAIDASGENITIDGVDLTDVGSGVLFEGTGNATINDVNITNAKDSLDITADDITITNVNLNNVTNGIKTNAKENLNVDDVEVDNIANGTAIDADSNGTANVNNVKVSNTNGTAVDVNATGDVKIDNVDMNNVNGQGINAESTTGNVDVTNTTANGGSGTAVNVNAPKGNATVINTTLNNYTGKSIVANANDTATIEGTTINGGNVTKPEAHANKTDIEPAVPSPDKAFNIPTNSTSNTPEFSVDMQDKNATGVFTVKVDGKEYNATLVDGKATIKVPALSDGTHTVEATLNGTGRYAFINNKGYHITTNITIARNNLTIKADNKAYVINYGGQYIVTLSSKVKDQEVSLIINGKTYTAKTDESGVAKFSLTKSILKSIGKKPIVVKFDGDSNYNPANTTAIITVNKEKTKITAKSVKKTYKKSKTKKLKITLKNSKKKAIKGKYKITLKVNKKLKGKVGKKLKKGYTFKVKFNKKGIGYIKLTAKKVKFSKKGTYKFTAKFKGNSVYNAATKKKIKMKVK